MAPPPVLHRILGICRFAVACVWLYQGLVPKLLGPSPDELAMAAAAGIPTRMRAGASFAAGVAELALGVCIVCLPRRIWPHAVSAAAVILLLAFVAVFAPAYLVGAFNPVVMNLTALALSIIAILILREDSADRR
jgi:hypothetical protein